MSNKLQLLGPWIRRFLMEHVVQERNLARNTQASYRDTLALLLPFVAARTLRIWSASASARVSPVSAAVRDERKASATASAVGSSYGISRMSGTRVSLRETRVSPPFMP